jgi:hypothetical protein
MKRFGWLIVIVAIGAVLFSALEAQVQTSQKNPAAKWPM